MSEKKPAFPAGSPLARLALTPEQRERAKAQGLIQQHWPAPRSARRDQGEVAAARERAGLATETHQSPDGCIEIKADATSLVRLESTPAQLGQIHPGFPIDRGVPIPAASGGRPWGSKYPFRQMKPGDSFFAPDKGTRKAGRPAAVHSAACYFAKRHPGYRFACRSRVENGVAGTRIWCLDSGQSTTHGAPEAPTERPAS